MSSLFDIQINKQSIMNAITNSSGIQTGVQHIFNPKLTLEVDGAGKLEFTIDDSSKWYRSIYYGYEIEALENGVVVFSGRMNETKLDYMNRQVVYCEGKLAYLNDSVLISFKEEKCTPAKLIEKVLEAHNSATFQGNRKLWPGKVYTNATTQFSVDVTYENCMTVLKRYLIDQLGGHLFVRYGARENGNGQRICYIDYGSLSAYGSSVQGVKVAKNLLDFNQTSKLNDHINAIIPYCYNPKYGMVDEDGQLVDPDAKEYLTIEKALPTSQTIGSGTNKQYLVHLQNRHYVYNQEDAKEYGLIYEAIQYDETDDPNVLMANAFAQLKKLNYDPLTVSVSALDLSYTDPTKYPAFKIGYTVTVDTKYFSDKIPITKIEIDMQNGTKKITLGLVNNKRKGGTYGGWKKEGANTVSTSSNNQMRATIFSNTSNMLTLSGVTNTVSKTNVEEIPNFVNPEINRSIEGYEEESDPDLGYTFMYCAQIEDNNGNTKTGKLIKGDTDTRYYFVLESNERLDEDYSGPYILRNYDTYERYGFNEVIFAIQPISRFVQVDVYPNVYIIRISRSEAEAELRDGQKFILQFGDTSSLDQEIPLKITYGNSDENQLNFYKLNLSNELESVTMADIGGTSTIGRFLLVYYRETDNGTYFELSDNKAVKDNLLYSYDLYPAYTMDGLEVTYNDIPTFASYNLYFDKSEGIATFKQTGSDYEGATVKDIINPLTYYYTGIPTVKTIDNGVNVSDDLLKNSKKVIRVKIGDYEYVRDTKIFETVGFKFVLKMPQINNPEEDRFLQADPSGQDAVLSKYRWTYYWYDPAVESDKQQAPVNSPYAYMIRNYGYKLNSVTLQRAYWTPEFVSEAEVSNKFLAITVVSTPNGDGNVNWRVDYISDYLLNIDKTYYKDPNDVILSAIEKVKANQEKDLVATNAYYNADYFQQDGANGVVWKDFKIREYEDVKDTVDFYEYGKKFLVYFGVWNSNITTEMPGYYMADTGWKILDAQKYDLYDLIYNYGDDSYGRHILKIVNLDMSLYDPYNGPYIIKIKDVKSDLELPSNYYPTEEQKYITIYNAYNTGGSSGITEYRVFDIEESDIEFPIFVQLKDAVFDEYEYANVITEAYENDIPPAMGMLDHPEDDSEIKIAFGKTTDSKYLKDNDLNVYKYSKYKANSLGYQNEIYLGYNRIIRIDRDYFIAPRTSFVNYECFTVTPIDQPLYTTNYVNKLDYFKNTFNPPDDYIGYLKADVDYNVPEIIDGISYLPLQLSLYYDTNTFEHFVVPDYSYTYLRLWFRFDLDNPTVAYNVENIFNRFPNTYAYIDKIYLHIGDDNHTTGAVPYYLDSNSKARAYIINETSASKRTTDLSPLGYDGINYVFTKDSYFFIDYAIRPGRVNIWTGLYANHQLGVPTLNTISNNDVNKPGSQWDEYVLGDSKGLKDYRLSIYLKNIGGSVSHYSVTRPGFKTNTQATDSDYLLWNEVNDKYLLIDKAVKVSKNFYVSEILDSNFDNKETVYDAKLTDVRYDDITTDSNNHVIVKMPLFEGEDVPARLMLDDSSYYIYDSSDEKVMASTLYGYYVYLTKDTLNGVDIFRYQYKTKDFDYANDNPSGDYIKSNPSGYSSENSYYILNTISATKAALTNLDGTVNISYRKISGYKRYAVMKISSNSSTTWKYIINSGSKSDNWYYFPSDSPTSSAAGYSSASTIFIEYEGTTMQQINHYLVSSDSTVSNYTFVNPSSVYGKYVQMDYFGSYSPSSDEGPIEFNVSDLFKVTKISNHPDNIYEPQTRSQSKNITISYDYDDTKNNSSMKVDLKTQFDDLEEGSYDNLNVTVKENGYIVSGQKAFTIRYSFIDESIYKTYYIDVEKEYYPNLDSLNSADILDSSTGIITVPGFIITDDTSDENTNYVQESDVIGKFAAIEVYTPATDSNGNLIEKTFKWILRQADTSITNISSEYYNEISYVVDTNDYLADPQKVLGSTVSPSSLKKLPALGKLDTGVNLLAASNQPNIDDLVDPGTYYVNDVTGMPEGTEGWVLIAAIEGKGEVPVRQIFFKTPTVSEDYEQSVFTRILNSSGKWSSWSELGKDSDVGVIIAEEYGSVPQDPEKDLIIKLGKFEYDKPAFVLIHPSLDWDFPENHPDTSVSYTIADCKVYFGREPIQPYGAWSGGSWDPTVVKGGKYNLFYYSGNTYSSNKLYYLGGSSKNNISVLSGGTEIPANSNLNDDKWWKIGNYYCVSASTMATITNVPPNAVGYAINTSTSGFTLKVYSGVGSENNYYIQELTYWNSKTTYRRNKHGGNGTIYEWLRFLPEHYITNYIDANNGSPNIDLNDFKTPGMYYIASITSRTISNIPSSSVNGWLLVLKSQSTVYKQIFFRHGSAPNTWRQIFQRHCVTDTWTKWDKITTEGQPGTHFGICSTAASTAAKEVTLSSLTNDIEFQLLTGMFVFVKFTNGNSSGTAPTLNVHGTGAKTIKFRESTLINQYYIHARSIHLFVYNGTDWELVDANYLDNLYSTYVASSNAEVRAYSVKYINENISTKLPLYGICSTAGSTAEKEVTVDSKFTLVDGAMVLVKFSNRPTSTTLTLNVNSTGAKKIWFSNGSLPASGNIHTNTVYMFMYDATNDVWQIINGNIYLPTSSYTTSYPYSYFYTVYAINAFLGGNPNSLPTDSKAIVPSIIELFNKIQTDYLSSNDLSFYNKPLYSVELINRIIYGLLNATQQNKVDDLVVLSNIQPKVFMTSNLDMNGNKINSGYGNNISLNRVYRFPSYVDAIICEWTCQTESISYDWGCIWSGEHSDYTAASNYGSSLVTYGSVTGKAGGTTQGTGSVTVTGNSVTCGFKSDGSNEAYYGFYVKMTPCVYFNTLTADDFRKILYDTSENPFSKVKYLTGIIDFNNITEDGIYIASTHIGNSVVFSNNPNSTGNHGILIHFNGSSKDTTSDMNTLYFGTAFQIFIGDSYDYVWKRTYVSGSGWGRWNRSSTILEINPSTEPDVDGSMWITT